MREFMLAKIQPVYEHGNHNITVTQWACACTPMGLLISMQLHASAHRQVLACPHIHTQTQLLEGAIYSYEDTLSNELLRHLLS